MQTLICATTNEQKFGIARSILKPFDITLERVALDIDEIQGENPSLIIENKVRKAYDLIGDPVAVTDDSWSIPVLNGFPGAYMKSMNHWLEPDDFIHLMTGKDDRTIILHQYVAFFDGQEVRIFNNDVRGLIVTEPSGTFGPPIMHVATMERDNGLTISETYDRGIAHDETRLSDPNEAWRKLANWLQK